MPSKITTYRGRKGSLASRLRCTRKRKFLYALQRTSHVGKASRESGVPVSTAYEWRNSDPEFFNGWMEALEIGYEQLEMELLDRVRNGVEEEATDEQGRISSVRRYDNKLALQVLEAHRKTVALIRAARGEAEEGIDARELLAQKLIDLHLRVRKRDYEPADAPDKDEPRRTAARHG